MSCISVTGTATMAMVEDFIGTWYKKLIGIPEENIYYNTGLMHVDYQKWRKNDFTGKILNEYKTTGKSYWLADQDRFGRGD